VLGFVRDGCLLALALGAKQRSELLRDVPTLAQAGAEEDLLAPDAPQVAARLNAARLEPLGGTGAELLELVKRGIPPE
jgi:tripartite-type tricarboxylate transporter receptor subunit TctC